MRENEEEADENIGKSGRKSHIKKRKNIIRKTLINLNDKKRKMRKNRYNSWKRLI